jgi:hypothetical protein
MTLKAVKSHTWLYPHRSLFRTPLSEFEAQAKESVSQLAATPMGRSVSAQEPAHTSYITPSSSHLMAPVAKNVSTAPKSDIPSVSRESRRHTVQLDYDRPQRKPRDENKSEKKVILEIPSGHPSRTPESDLVTLSLPPAPALARSATTTTTTRTTTLHTVEESLSEKSRQENRPPSETSSVSAVSRPPTARPTMPHSSKPRPTSYHPPSGFGGVSMTKGRSVSGERPAPLVHSIFSSS